MEDLESQKIINATLRLQSRILYNTNIEQANKLTQFDNQHYAANPVILNPSEAIAERINEVNLGGALNLNDNDKKALYDYLVKQHGKKVLLLSDEDIIDNMLQFYRINDFKVPARLQSYVNDTYEQKLKLLDIEKEKLIKDKNWFNSQ